MSCSECENFKVCSSDEVTGQMCDDECHDDTVLDVFDSIKEAELMISNPCGMFS
jgi:hypothetical protein